jgi:hypothetical protein
MSMAQNAEKLANMQGLAQLAGARGETRIPVPARPQPRLSTGS